MPWLLNAFHLLLLLLISPWLVYKAATTGKYRRGLRDKFFGLHRGVDMPGSPVWFHGVSVGEIHLLRQVVAAFRQRWPERALVISTTTDTGFDEARKCFPDVPIIYFPLDFSWAVRRTLAAVDPALIVLAESELWPNFLGEAKRRGVPVAVINGRMSPRTFARYRRLGGLARWLFGRLDLLAMQTEEYAGHLVALGVSAERVHVTGSVKYDGAATDRHNPRTTELRRLLNVQPKDLVWIAGSTQVPEEEIALGIYQRLLAVFPTLRLFLVPRQKDRFDDVARLLDRSGLPYVRRSALNSPLATRHSPLVLMDTIGALGALWGLADVAFVGGSMDGQRGGQNMIEPAAYGAAVVFGPHVWNFKDAAARLVAAEAAIQVTDAAGLEEAVHQLLADAAKRQYMGEKARAFVLAQQGATQRTLDLLERLLHDEYAGERAA